MSEQVRPERKQFFMERRHVRGGGARDNWRPVNGRALEDRTAPTQDVYARIHASQCGAMDENECLDKSQQKEEVGGGGSVRRTCRLIQTEKDFWRL